MRKLLTLIIAPILLITGLQAQTITQQEADALVLEKMSGETRPYSIFAKEDIQQAGTVLESWMYKDKIVLQYESWIYFVRISGDFQFTDHYYVIKANSGSLLEINIKDDRVMASSILATWRVVSIMNYPDFQGTKWKFEGIVNSITGDIQTIKPDCEECFSIEFITQTKALIRQLANIPYWLRLLDMGFWLDDGWPLEPSEIIFVHALFDRYTVSFSVTTDELRFINNYKNYYLLYKPIE